MGNGCKYNHHFQYQHGLNPVQKSAFLPMLCSRTSIKDVALQQPRPLPGSSASNSSSSSSSSNDPLSPKIGCMGQVKRHNKITGLTATSTCHFGTNKLALTTTSNNDVSYFKLKRFFFAKNLNNNSNAICTGSFCRRRRTRTRRCNNNNTVGVTESVSCGQRGRNENQGMGVCFINIAEMDPPLPVIKRVPKPTDCEEDVSKNSLWKRRSNGGALKILELQHIQIPRYQVEILTV